jgi:hypothetical protein
VSGRCIARHLRDLANRQEKQAREQCSYAERLRALRWRPREPAPEGPFEPLAEAINPFLPAMQLAQTNQEKGNQMPRLASAKPVSAADIHALLERQHQETLAAILSLATRLDALEARTARSSHGPEVSPAAVEIASDADLSGPYGNPEVRKDPPWWTGQSYAGCRMSDCPPDYLENLASFFGWKARKDDESNAVDGKGNPKSKWSRLDAARARGWARRNANKPGRPKPAAPKPAEQVPWGDDDQPPFLSDIHPHTTRPQAPGRGLGALKGPAMTPTLAVSILLAFIGRQAPTESRRYASIDLLFIASMLALGTHEAAGEPTAAEVREALLVLRRELDTTALVERHRRLARYVGEQAERAGVAA